MAHSEGQEKGYLPSDSSTDGKEKGYFPPDNSTAGQEKGYLPSDSSLSDGHEDPHSLSRPAQRMQRRGSCSPEQHQGGQQAGTQHREPQKEQKGSQQGGTQQTGTQREVAGNHDPLRQQTETEFRTPSKSNLEVLNLELAAAKRATQVLELDEPHRRTSSPLHARARGRGRLKEGPSSRGTSPAHPKYSLAAHRESGARSPGARPRALNPLHGRSGSGGIFGAYPRHPKVTEAESFSNRSGSTGRMDVNQSTAMRGELALHDAREGDRGIPSSVSHRDDRERRDHIRDGDRGVISSASQKERGVRGTRSPLRSRLGTLESPLAQPGSNCSPRQGTPSREGARQSPLHLQGSPSLGVPAPSRELGVEGEGPMGDLGRRDHLGPRDDVGSMAAWARRPVTPIRSPRGQSSMGPRASAPELKGWEVTPGFEGGTVSDFKGLFSAARQNQSPRQSQSPRHSPVESGPQLKASRGRDAASSPRRRAAISRNLLMSSEQTGFKGFDTVGDLEGGTISDDGRAVSSLAHRRSPLHRVVAGAGARDCKDGTNSERTGSPLWFPGSPGKVGFLNGRDGVLASGPEGSPRQGRQCSVDSRSLAFPLAAQEAKQEREAEARRGRTHQPWDSPLRSSLGVPEADPPVLHAADPLSNHGNVTLKAWGVPEHDHDDDPDEGVGFELGARVIEERSQPGTVTLRAFGGSVPDDALFESTGRGQGAQRLGPIEERKLGGWKVCADGARDLWAAAELGEEGISVPHSSEF